MLAYAAFSRPAARSASPRTLTLIVAGHAVAIFLVMTARGDIPSVIKLPNPQIIFIDPPAPPPPPPPPTPQVQPHRASTSTIENPTKVVRQLTGKGPTVATGPTLPDTGPLVGPSTDPTPVPLPLPTPTIVRKAARFVTAPNDVRPPYPDAKRALEQEASLRLALTIGADGRVTAVDPVGRADATFLDAARRHILRRWRYAPATEDGRPVASRIVVTLTFKLEQ